MKRAIFVKAIAVISILLLIVSITGLILTPMTYDGIWVTIIGVISLICAIIISVEDGNK